MCGIGGVFAPDWAVGFPEIETVTLWEGLTTRGGHAHGFALSMEGSQAPLVMKWPGPSTDNCDLLQSLLELDAKHMGGSELCPTSYPIRNSRICEGEWKQPPYHNEPHDCHTQWSSKER